MPALKLTTDLVDDIANLSFSCSGLAMGVAATAVGASGGVIVGGAAAAGVFGFKALAKNCKAVPDSPRQLKRIQEGLLEKWVIIARANPDNMAAFDACQKPLRAALPQCSVDPKTLAAIIRNPEQLDFPSSATHYVLTRIAAIDARFSDGIERQFAAAVIQAGFEAAIEDRKYFEALEPHLLLGMAKDVAETKRNMEDLKSGRAETHAKIDDLAEQLRKKDDVIDALRRRDISDKSERRAIRMLDTIDTDDMSVDQIFIEILNRLDAADKIDAQAAQRSNYGSDFDRLVQAVADALEADADGQSAIQQVEDALAAHAAERDKMLELGIQTAIAAGQAAKVAAFEIERLSLPRDDWYDQVFGCKDMYHQDGLIRGVRQSLQIAAEICFQAAEYAPSRQIWAALKNSEAISLSILGERGDAAALARSVTAYEAALAVYTRDAAPMDWAMTQNNLANALLTLGQRGDDAVLSRSVTAFEAALEVLTREAAPMQWAMTQNNLANALLTLGERGYEAALSRSVTAFEAALEVRTREAAPMDWAMTQNNLANAFLALGKRGDEAALSRSVTTYEAALEVYTREAAPMDWAATQNNLANALLTLGQRGDEAALSRSVTAYEAALEVRTREATPMDWAMTRGNMGLLYLFRAERGELDYLDLAISAFEDALSVYSEEHHPYDFGTASSVLQKALALRDGSPPDA
jgi:tetratricopeptide (TPR) repeat protein